MAFNWKILGTMMTVVTAGVSILASVVDNNQRKEEIKEEVARQLAEKENEES